MPNMMFCLPTYLHMPSRKSEMTLKLRRTVQMDHILNKVRNFRDIPKREKTFLAIGLIYVLMKSFKPLFYLVLNYLQSGLFIFIRSIQHTKTR